MFDDGSNTVAASGHSMGRDAGPTVKLQIVKSNLPETANAACTILASKGRYFCQNESLIELLPNHQGRSLAIHILDHSGVVNAVHKYCTPFSIGSDNKESNVTLPDRVAKLLLSMVPEKFPRFKGFRSTPKLTSDGGIAVISGYDLESGFYYHDVPELSVPLRPTPEQAQESFAAIRQPFRTFCFEDAVLDCNGYVDQNKPPGVHESACLVALLSAACRPALNFAPGFLVTAPTLTGSGAGKGLLVRLISIMACGTLPKIVNASPKPGEFETRIASALMENVSALLIDGAVATCVEIA